MLYDRTAERPSLREQLDQAARRGDIPTPTPGAAGESEH